MMKPTFEQNEALRSDASVVVVNALAGTGKTTFCRMLTSLNKDKNYIYVSYNRENVNNADLPKNNAISLTWHQVAYRFVGKYYKHKLGDNLSLLASSGS